MPVRRRYLAPQVLRDLRRKMVFVSGPRQVGKTTLARSLPGARVGYLNWDVAGAVAGGRSSERVPSRARVPASLVRLKTRPLSDGARFWVEANPGAYQALARRHAAGVQPLD